MGPLAGFSFLLRAKEGVTRRKPAKCQSHRHFHGPSLQVPSPKRLSDLKINVQEVPTILNTEVLLAAVLYFKSPLFE